MINDQFLMAYEGGAMMAGLPNEAIRDAAPAICGR